MDKKSWRTEYLESTLGGGSILEIFGFTRLRIFSARKLHTFGSKRVFRRHTACNILHTHTHTACAIHSPHPNRSVSFPILSQQLPDVSPQERRQEIQTKLIHTVAAPQTSSSEVSAGQVGRSNLNDHSLASLLVTQMALKRAVWSVVVSTTHTHTHTRSIRGGPWVPGASLWGVQSCL